MWSLQRASALTPARYSWCRIGQHPGTQPSAALWAWLPFRKFKPEFASTTACFTRLFRKGVTWSWTPACQEAFEVKALPTTAHVLKVPNHTQEFTIVADASGVGIGAVLLQGDRPIAFDGGKLTDTELK